MFIGFLQRHPARSAYRILAYRIVELDTLLGQPVKVWRDYGGMPGTAQTLCVMLVRQDEYHI